jgi:hypothetical protein
MADRSKKRDYGEKTRINPFSPRPSFQLVRRSANNRAYRRPGSRPPPSGRLLIECDCIAAWRKYHSRGWWRWYDYWADSGRQLVSRTRLSSRQGAKLGGKMDTDPKTEKPTDFDLEIAVFGAP